MTSRARLAWTAAACTYALIVLGAVVRITGSGLGCGEHWPLCNGRLLPPLDVPTMIEYGHRLAAGLVTILVVWLAIAAWRDSRTVPPSERPSVRRLPFLALALLAIQITLGAVTVKLDLPPWVVVLHLGTAMLLLAVLLVLARGPRTPSASEGSGRPLLVALALVTVLFGAVTANSGAATACLGFPLCNGQVFPDGNALQHLHWTHRLLAYALAAGALWWALRARRRGAWALVGVIALQVMVGAAMILGGLPHALQAAHAAVGTAVWAAAVLALA